MNMKSSKWLIPHSKSHWFNWIHPCWTLMTNGDIIICNYISFNIYFGFCLSDLQLFLKHIDTRFNISWQQIAFISVLHLGSSSRLDNQNKVRFTTTNHDIQPYLPNTIKSEIHRENKLFSFIYSTNEPLLQHECWEVKGYYLLCFGLNCILKYSYLFAVCAYQVK
jgi:hypothetical protein